MKPLGVIHPRFLVTYDSNKPTSDFILPMHECPETINETLYATGSLYELAENSNFTEMVRTSCAESNVTSWMSSE